MTEMPAAMTKVLAGLATAFDTTFLGLLFAALVMLPTMMLRRAITNQFLVDYSILIEGLSSGIRASDTTTARSGSDGKESNRDEQ